MFQAGHSIFTASLRGGGSQNNTDMKDINNSTITINNESL